MKSYITFIIIILISGILSNDDNHKDDIYDSPEYSEFRAFIVKTKLTKEELEELILKNKKGNKAHIEEIKNNDKTISPKEEVIQDEMKDNNNKVFITKEEKSSENFFYEKKYGKKYAYLTLLIGIILIIYLKNKIFKEKTDNYLKNNNNNVFEYEDIKEYMLVKSE